jgi:hypothetical protein
MLGRRDVWLPRRLMEKNISPGKMSGLTADMLPWVRRMERFIRPRLSWAAHERASCLFGFLGLLMALTMCIPTPGTHSVPALGIALMAAGVIMGDGLAVLAGAIVGTVWMLLLVAIVVVFGPQAFHFLSHAIRSVL